MGQAEANTPSALSQQELLAAREEAELTLEQLHLVQEELEVYFLKAEELTETLQQRDARISELQQHLEQAKGADLALQQLQNEHEQQIQQLQQQLSDRDTQMEGQLAALQQQLLEANARCTEVDSRAENLQGLLSTAQKMLEGQANYLQDLSRKEEEAELAIERERQYTREVLYFLQNSTATPGIDPNRIPLLRGLLQSAVRNQATTR